MKNIKNKYCKGCKYKTPDRIHGHGEYYGSCTILTWIVKETDNYTVNDIVSDNSICRIQKGTMEYNKDTITIDELFKRIKK